MTYRQYRLTKSLTRYFQESVCQRDGCSTVIRFWISSPRYFCSRECRYQWQRGKGRASVQTKPATP